ncbi:DNA repair protein [Aaosphaeria arxii CBS 175.79]|uniref:DNA repair protein REV1 n=1 Tax=Aaosphaeria arxii CBS 175.79 TaxID=1450172 RepID=A0A6A5XFI6_9PLEO|nr:DNA repair protein [Aaosphaeria arxii CBS 175.79]KAF2011898.1 DNA repair protein [Aaosphaeria arxii CBS 175.79]
MGSRLEANSNAVRKRIANHTFEDEEGDEYEGSAFGGFSDYFRRKKIKLQNLDAEIRAQSTQVPPIFRGVVAHVNGYTQPSLNDLHTMIVQHGGGFMQYLDGKTTVTHIIASSLTPKKAVEFKRYRIVKPAWVVDSIQAGKLLPWNDYRVVDEGENQKLLAFDSGVVTSRTNFKSRGYRDQTENSWYTSQLRGSQAGSSSKNNASNSPFPQQLTSAPEDDIEELPDHIDRASSNQRLTRTNIDVQPPADLETHSKIHHSRDPTKAFAQQPLVNDMEGETSHAINYQSEDIQEVSNPDATATRAASPQHDERVMDWIDRAKDQDPATKKILTAEEHNAILLRDPKIRKSTVVDPNFLEQYYRESRLHHLSTWKADLKSQLQALANQKTSSQKLQQKRAPGTRRYVLHVDFDSFFAAVSLKKHPHLKDKPAVVAHGNGSGSEIASCNYPARTFGVKNGMWMKKALELCPDLNILPYDFPAYEEASRAFYDVILATDGVVQSVSIDEALIDISATCIAAAGSDGKNLSEGSIYREQAKADELAQTLRDNVKVRTDCNVSVGIGGNILLAKVALRKAKPAGQHQIKPEEVLDFIGVLQVQDLPGVAWSIGGKLEEIGIKFVKDIRDVSKERLVQTLGPKTGEKLWEYSRGIDKAEVGEQVTRKSVSAEVNWGVRFENQEQADEFIANLCGELQKRLLKEKVKGKQFTMKVMRRSPTAPLDPPKHLGHGKCDTFNKSLVLGVATNAKEVLTKEALSILKGFGFSPGELRGIGVQMTKLEPMRSATDGSLEGSQRRLQFKGTTAEPVNTRKGVAFVDVDPIQDDPETPKKPKVAESEHVSFGASQLNQSTPSRRPLNTAGTQFLIPTQVDPQVLAELPEDIRSKLMRQARQTSPTPGARHTSKTGTKVDQTLAPAVPMPLTALPPQSQLDPEILAALPPDVRAEVIAQYAAGATPGSPSRAGQRKQGDQTLLPQSPRKNRFIGIAQKKPVVPVKRGRGRPPKSAQLAAAATSVAKDKNGKTLTQASFLTRKNPAKVRVAEESDSARDSVEPEDAVATVEGLDPEFLAGLPEDLRKEVLEDERRRKLQNSRLVVHRMPKPRPNTRSSHTPEPRPRDVLIIPRPPMPTFTARNLFKPNDLRGALKDWITEFADEGPYSEDVDTFILYLEKVVIEERDMAKALGIIKWMEWIVGELEDGATVKSTSTLEWERTVGQVKDAMNGAAHKRGLGDVSFE